MDGHEWQWTANGEAAPHRYNIRGSRRRQAPLIQLLPRVLFGFVEMLQCLRRWRDPQLFRPTISSGEEAPDASGYGILRHLRIGKLPQLFQGRMTLGVSQMPGLGEMIRHIVSENFKSASYLRCRCDGGLRRSPHICVVEISKTGV